nr:hypothetical protein [uncultured Lichenicoccus sp.]
MSILARLVCDPDLLVLIPDGPVGIGAALASAYVEAGTRVHVCEVSEDAPAAFRERHPGQLTTRPDVAQIDEASVSLAARSPSGMRPARRGRGCW